MPMKTIMSSMTQSVYAKKRELGGKPVTFIGGIPMIILERNIRFKLKIRPEDLELKAIN